MSFLICSEHGGQREASCTQSPMLLWCWVVSKLWEMFHYHLPFIKIVNVVSLFYNLQPLCFICIMTFVILFLDATKNFLHAHFHMSNRERPIFLSHKHYVFPLWNAGSKLILQNICIICFQLAIVNEHQLSRNGFICELNHAPRSSHNHLCTHFL
jgi:hypothetical protein